VKSAIAIVDPCGMFKLLQSICASASSSLDRSVVARIDGHKIKYHAVGSFHQLGKLRVVPRQRPTKWVSNSHDQGLPALCAGLEQA